jgi:type II secretory pathway component PulF
MLRSGLSLTYILEILEQEATKIRLRDSLARLRDEVRNGRSLSEAMSRQPKMFAPLACRLIQSAEASGQMADACAAIAANLEFWRELRLKIVSAALYPALVLLVGFGVLCFLLFSLVPKFEKAFGAKILHVPWMAKSLFSLSHWAHAFWPWLIAFILCSPLLAWLIWRHQASRDFLLDQTLRIPVLGPVFVTAAVTRAGHSLALLLGAGVPLIDSLRMTASLLFAPVMQNTFNKAADRVLNGMSLRDSLHSGFLPPTVTGLITVGEQTGALPGIMKEIGSYYQEELDRRVQMLARMIEPALLIVVGGIVGYVYIAFFQCVISLNKR